MRSSGGLRRPKTLCVLVLASDHPDFFIARYDIPDTSQVAFAPTESEVTSFIDSMLVESEYSRPRVSQGASGQSPPNALTPEISRSRVTRR